jgi:hypothetical protein
MIEITHEEVEKFLLETEFDHKPGQGKISFPVIQRIHRRLQQGNSFGAIKICDGIIVDGHHRYISHKLLKLNPETVPGGANSEYIEYVWTKINLVSIDYDSDEMKQDFEERYDSE